MTFPRSHPNHGFSPRLVSPRVPPGEGEPRSKSDRGTKRGLPPRTRNPPPPPRGARPGPGRCLPAAGRRLQGRGAHGFGGGLGRPRRDTRVWLSAAAGSPPRCSHSRAAVIGPARHVGGQRASLPATRNPLPAPRPGGRRLQGPGDRPRIQA